MALDLTRVADRVAPPRALDIGTWTKTKRDGFLWSKQLEVADSVEQNRFTAVKSAHGTGKSYLAADILAWWIDQHPLGDAFAISTAPTAPQVEAILWREINVAHQQGNLPGRITWGQVPSWKIGDTMVAYGRKPADYADPNKAMQAFQGIHARFVLVILDEACGIPVWLWNAVDSIVTNDNARVLAIGNPDDPSSEFEKICRPGSDYNTITISAFDLPWATGEEVPEHLAEKLTGEGWVKERKRKWGEGSPLYQSKVLGEFPDLSDDSLITPKWVREAVERDLTVEAQGIGQMGGDVARLGVDKSVAYHDVDGVIRQVGEWHKQVTTKTAGHFAILLRDNPGVVMKVDISGLGAGVFDMLHEEQLSVQPFDGGSGPTDPIRFVNKRAESYWRLRERFELGLVDLDAQDLDLQAELVSIKWTVDRRGRIVIESKEDMRKRGLPSPDHADAVMMAGDPPVVVMDVPEGLPPGLTDDLLERAM